MTLLEMQIEQAALDAEELASELLARDAEGAALLARGLRRMARDVRLSLVAQVSAESMTRLHLRIEQMLRVGGAALLSAMGEAQASDGETTQEEEPRSQRPTMRPPALYSAEALFEHDPEGEITHERERETVRPPALKGMPTLHVPRLDSPGVHRTPPRPEGVRSVSGLRRKNEKPGESIGEETLRDAPALGRRR